MPDEGGWAKNPILAWHALMQAGELPVAPSLVAVVQIATKLGVIDVGVHLGGQS